MVVLQGYQSFTHWSCALAKGRVDVAQPTSIVTSSPTTETETMTSIKTMTASASMQLPASDNSTSQSSGTSESATAAEYTTTPSPDEGSSGPDTATIAGGVVGGLAGLALICGGALFILHRIRVKRREAEYANDTPEMSGAPYTDT